MRKNKTTQVMAILALLWIVIWIIWTGVLFIFSNSSSQQEISAEQYAELQEYINSLSWTTNTWSLEETNTLTWETN